LIWSDQIHQRLITAIPLDKSFPRIRIRSENGQTILPHPIPSHYSTRGIWDSALF